MGNYCEVFAQFCVCIEEEQAVPTVTQEPLLSPLPLQSSGADKR